MKPDKKVAVELRTTASALLELSQELGISESDTGGKVSFEGKDPYVASKHHLGESTATLLALFGMELAAIWKLRTPRTGQAPLLPGDDRAKPALLGAP